MANILVHGLGQDETSWNEVKNQLNNNGIKIETHNLFSIVKNYQVNYENMYKTFADYCNIFKDNYKLSYEEIKSILGFDIYHSFLTYKKEAKEYGYEAYKISIKEKTIIFNRI